MTDIPDKALESHIAILGKTGSGKSNTAKVVAERIMADGGRVCVLDPTGTWWGMRLRADGRKPSKFAPVIFGGLHADIPIAAEHGAAIGEAVATSSTSSVIDTRTMTVGARTRFFTGFAEALLRANKGTLHLIIDEAHVFAPQGRVNDPASGAMLHAANNLVSLGRGIGLRIVLISQRPAKLHKDSLTQVETLVAMRLIAPQDRRAIDEWVGEWADPAQGRELVGSLASLPTGHGWVWAPELGILHRVRFPLASTFDSGRPLAGGDAPALGPIDVGAVTAQLEQIRADVVANDPARLKRRIAELEALAKNAGPNAIDLEAAEEKAYARGREDGFREGRDVGGRRAANNQFLRVVEAISTAGMLNGHHNAFDEVLARLRAIDIGPAAGEAEPPPVISREKVARSRIRPPATVTGSASPPTIVPATSLPDGDPSVSGPQKALLDALAWWESAGQQTPSRAMVAAVCGWNVTSGHLKNVAGSLKARGLVDYPTAGALALTPAGRSIAIVPAGTLQERLQALLSGPQRQVFDALAGGALHREQVAAALGWNASSGHLKNVAGSLKTLDILTYPAAGMLERSPWTFAGASA